MLRSIFIVITSLFLLTGCLGPAGTDQVVFSDWEKQIDSSEIVHAIQEYLAYLRHEKRLRLEDSSIWYDHTVNKVRMEFTSQDVLEVREARFLIVDLAEGLLAELNRNPIIAPQLASYPLTADALDIYINFESFHGRYVDPYYVGRLVLVDGQVTFTAFDAKAPGRNKWNFRTEPYVKSREFTVYEREAEKLFRQTVEIERARCDQAEEPIRNCLRKEEYKPIERDIPRYFSPYKRSTIFDY